MMTLTPSAARTITLTYTVVWFIFVLKVNFSEEEIEAQTIDVCIGTKLAVSS